MRSLCLAVSLLVTVGTIATAQAPTQPKPNKANLADLRKAELFIAITQHDFADVKAALVRGADPNGRNWLDFTPLMWASARGDREIVDILLARGAKLDATSIYGSALTFAALGRHEDLALYLLGKGIAPNPWRADGATPLMLAAANGHAHLIDALLRRRCSANQKDGDGATALLYAARLGQTPIVRRLLGAGANPDIADSHGRTALLYGAANGHAGAVDLLLSRHAAVNARDKEGATALLLAARYSGDPAVIRSLLKSGADAAARDGHGQTALALTQSRGFADAAAMLRASGAPASLQSIAVRAPRSAHQAIENSLTALQAGLKGFAAAAQCTSCHHQGLGLMAVGLAGQRGFHVDRALIGSLLMRMGKEAQQNGPFIHQALQDPNAAKMVPAVDIGDISIGSGYIVGGLIANKIPANPGLAEMAQFIANQQAADGRWGFGIDREPIQSSPVTTTALVLQVLRTYGAQDRLAPCYARAKQWLLTTPAPNTEDRASRLLGLLWAGASKEEMQKPLQELLALQRPDGGWAQLPALHSDAYATGMALYALRVAGGIAVGDAGLQRGVAYLLRTQDEDGSWFVNKRTLPANHYFDAGFPHGESQYISFGATCWATMGLIEASEPEQTARR